MFNRLEKLGCGAINSEENVWLIGYLEAKSPSFQDRTAFVERVPSLLPENDTPRL